MHVASTGSVGMGVCKAVVWLGCVLVMVDNEREKAAGKKVNEKKRQEEPRESQDEKAI